MEQKKVEKPWYKKTWGIVLIVIFSLIVLANMGKNKTVVNPSSTKSSKSENNNKEQWTQVIEFTGSGMKKSPIFTLSGGQARIKYKYNSGDNLGIGMFSIYVVDEGDDIMKTGGIPEIMTQEENEESESYLQKDSGNYYLNVNAQGKWVIVVEEKK